MSRCPYERASECPLYAVGHVMRASLSHLLRFCCVDDMAKPCRVERGVWNYEAAESRLRCALPIRAGVAHEERVH